MNSNASSAWEIIPMNTVHTTILIALFVYFWFRHLFLTLMVMDIILGWLRQFRWFPKEGKRLKAVVHWLIALGLFIGYLVVAKLAGWLEFVPTQQ